MTRGSSTQAGRAQLLADLFPAGIPTLWCPLLTHYAGDGTLDRGRLEAHIRHLAPWVKGFLIPGSTGDGWEMTEAEIVELLDCALGLAGVLRVQVLIGVLKTDAAKARRDILHTMAWLKMRGHTAETAACLVKNHVCGFTICPPRGKGLADEDLRRGLETILELELPTALYQLPQVTQNQMSPELVAELARRFTNFFLFKDTSGEDRVASSGLELGGIFMVRGAEGSYDRWLKPGGGPYDGWLLSSANGFARELHQVAEDLAAGRNERASQLSARLTAAVGEVFRVVAELRGGNPFANANKAIDHFFAHGARGATAPPPRLHCGQTLPVEVIRATGEVLDRHGLLPRKGYLA
ncbi:MAG: dihydrodipicolinate synthase family protein [Verrucomicrobia bacterium]|nr:dihydrodipicolinate synthase family protein [Verrucomicrobiota bacterium]